MRLPRPFEKSLDFAPSVVFAVFLLSGAIYILMAKYIRLSPAYVSSVPVLLMLGYAAMVIFAPRLRLREDQTADNFYYLGFLYTLVSLAVSLYQYAGGGDVDEIIRNFGIAVSSTITGIALRIVFNQMRRDPVEIEQATRLELAEAAQKVRRELDGVRMEFTQFRAANQQILEDGYAEIKDKVSAAAQAIIAEMEKLSKTAFEKFGAASDAVDLKNFREQVAQTSGSIGKLNKTLGDSGTKLQQAAAAASGRLEAMQTPDKVIEVTMQPALASLSTAIEQMSRRLDEHATRLAAERSVAVRAVAEMPVESLRSAVDSLNANVTRLNAAVENSAAAIRRNGKRESGAARPRKFAGIARFWPFGRSN